MTSNHRKQARAKRQRYADPMAMFKALGRVQALTWAEQVAMSLPVRLSFEALRTGKAGKDDFNTIATAVNIAMIAAEQIDPLVEKTCVDARDSLMAIHGHHDHGGYAPTPAALADIEQAIDIYEQLASLVTGGQLNDVIGHCVDRIRNGEVVGSVV